MVRAPWLLLLLLAAPLAAAQAELRPSLTLEPSVLDVAPGGTSSARVNLHNPLDRELALLLETVPGAGVKARLEATEVVVPPRSEKSLALTVLAPNASGSHFVHVNARAKAATSPSAVAPHAMNATLEVRTGIAPDTKPLPADQGQLLILVDIDPRSIELWGDENATATLAIENPTSEPLPISDRVRFDLPSGFGVLMAPHAPRIPAGERVEIPLTFFRDRAEPLTNVSRATVWLEGSPAPPTVFDVRRVEVAVTVGDPEAVRNVVLVASVAGAAGTWTALWLTRRHWWPFLLLLYTRLRPSKMLDHPVRRKIVDVVQAQPGITFGELARAVGIAPGQLTHHARMLEKAGIVFNSPDGQTRRFFHVAAGRMPSVAPLGERALVLLRSGPRTTSDLARELGVSRQSLHYHVKQLVAEGKVTTRSEGHEIWLAAAA